MFCPFVVLFVASYFFARIRLLKGTAANKNNPIQELITRRLRTCYNQDSTLPRDHSIFRTVITTAVSWFLAKYLVSLNKKKEKMAAKSDLSLSQRMVAMGF